MTTDKYAGLTDSEVFNLMTATHECKDELTALVQWSAWRHWVLGCCVATVSFMGISATGATLINPVSGIKAGLVVGAIIVAVTWKIAHSKIRRRHFLETLSRSLRHFDEAAKVVPGASSELIIETMPEVTQGTK